MVHDTGKLDKCWFVADSVPDDVAGRCFLDADAARRPPIRRKGGFHERQSHEKMVVCGEAIVGVAEER